jgi:hypothetical protein
LDTVLSGQLQEPIEACIAAEQRRQLEALAREAMGADG